MRGLLHFVTFACTAVGVYARDYIHEVKETIEHPHGWTKHSQPSADHKIVLRIALPQPNFKELERHLYEVSDPDHHRYGQHLSKEEVDALVAPHQASLDTVDDWLSSYGIGEADLTRSSAKDWVTVKVPLSLAEEMLGTKYHVWKHTESGEYLVRTTSYSLPKHLHEHVDLVQPTTLFSGFKPQTHTTFFPWEDSIVPVASVGSNKVVNRATDETVDPLCRFNLTVSCIKQLYNAVGYVPSAKVGNSIAITGYLNDFVNNQDLQTYYAEQRPDALNSTFKFISVNGGQNDQNLSRAGFETNMDSQIAFGISYPVEATFYSNGEKPVIPGQPPSEADDIFTGWLDYVLSHPNPPLVISTSYVHPEQEISKGLATRACQSFAQLGARGVSLLFASGNFGVGRKPCVSNDGTNSTLFQPSFPASCPYVTAVGGTTGLNPEVAIDKDASSGGGFSNYFSRPAYQAKAVQGYVDSLPEGLYKGFYNPEGRGLPDVAAQAAWYRVFVRGKSYRMGGTSAASPAVAGIVALLNDVRLQANQPPLGFLNPFIYSKGFQGLNDITSGKGPGCGTQGFNATAGWDPVTGYGSPNFGKLKEIVLEDNESVKP